MTGGLECKELDESLESQDHWFGFLELLGFSCSD